MSFESLTQSTPKGILWLAVVGWRSQLFQLASEARRVSTSVRWCTGSVCKVTAGSWWPPNWWWRRLFCGCRRSIWYASQTTLSQSLYESSSLILQGAQHVSPRGLLTHLIQKLVVVEGIITKCMFPELQRDDVNLTSSSRLYHYPQDYGECSLRRSHEGDDYSAIQGTNRSTILWAWWLVWTHHKLSTMPGAMILPTMDNNVRIMNVLSMCQKYLRNLRGRGTHCRLSLVFQSFVIFNESRFR